MEQTARILFEKFLNGTCSKKELERLMDILKQNEHEAEFRSMLEAVYSDIDTTLRVANNKAETDGFAQGENSGHSRTPDEGPRKANSPRKLWLSYLVGAAACLLLGFGISYIWNRDPTGQSKHPDQMMAAISMEHPFKEGTYKNQTTNRAEQKYLLLPDGTQVWLNAESSLIVPEKFDQKERVVYLKGEAFFDVKHADKIPFIIHLPNHVITKVLGTAFDIKAYPDQEFSVTVKRGKVQVSKDKKQLATLTMGQQIKMIQNQDIQPVIQEVRKDYIASWTEGKLSYNAMPLSDILKDLERVYNVDITLKRQQLSEEIFTTTFNKGDGIKEVLRTLSLLTGTSFKEDNNNDYILE